MARAPVKKISFKKSWKKYAKRKKKSNRKAVSRVSRFNAPDRLPGIPKRKRARLFYSDFNNVTPSVAGTVVGHYWSPNCLYDPNESGGGHQPFGHDQWSLYYKKYRVNSAVFSIKFMWATPHTAPLPEPMHCGIRMDKNLLIDSSFPATMIELQRGKDHGILKGNSRECVSLSGKFVRTKFFDRVGGDDSSTWTTFGSHPAFVAHLIAWVAQANGGTSQPPITCQIRMWQDVEFCDPITPASS